MTENTEQIIDIVQENMFIEFLKGNQVMIKINEKIGNGVKVFIKIHNTSEIDLLYYQYDTNLKYSLNYENKLEFQGIWNNTTQTLYEISYNLEKILEKNVEKVKTISKKEIENKINVQLDERLFYHINIHYDLLKKTVTKEYKEEYYGKYNKPNISKIFLDSKDNQINTFLPKSNIKLNSTQLIDYIIGKNSQVDLINIEWDKFLKKYESDLGMDILNYEFVKEQIEIINSDCNHELHKIKAILKAMGNDYKTVNVTIKKDDVLFTFKTEARIFRYYNGQNLSTYNLVAQDRKQFEQLFGRYSNYNYHEIVKITYGKQVLYEDKKLL